MSCRIPPFSIAGYKGALGRRGGLPWLRALPACAHRLSARRAGSAAPPGAHCGVTVSPQLPGAESPPTRRSWCPVQGHLQPVTPTVPGAVSTHTLLPVRATPVRLLPELPAARSPPASRSAELLRAESRLLSRCSPCGSRMPPGHADPAEPFSLASTAGVSARVYFRRYLMFY